MPSGKVETDLDEAFFVGARSDSVRLAVADPLAQVVVGGERIVETEAGREPFAAHFRRIAGDAAVL